MEINLRKNSIIDLQIDNADGEGFGIGRLDGFTVFVEGALPGERLRARIVKLKPRYAFAKIEKVITPSPHRIAPECPVAARCGGCQWQHCDYAEQLAIKKRVVTDALVRIGGIANPPVADVLGADEPFHYRNKAQFPVGMDGKDTVIGFYAPRSHRIVPVTHCNIQHPAHTAVLTIMRDHIRRHDIPSYDEETHTGLLRHIVMKAGGTDVMVALVVNGGSLPGERALSARLTEAGVTTVLVNTNTTRTNVVLGEYSRILTGDGFVRAHIGDIAYRLSVRSFFQVNAMQAKTLYGTALAFGAFTGTETVIDAHAGVGGVALYAARSVKQVYGVEMITEAVRDAEYNAGANNIGNVQFIRGTAEDVLPVLLTDGGEWAEQAVQADAIFLDPPRKGCGAPLLDAIIKARIPKVIYISCDPATLARDIKRLAEGGYTLDKVQPVDMFPMTGKVECVVRLLL